MQSITTTLAAITPAQVKSLQRGVRIALIIGVATSIAANVIHALVNHPTAADTLWRMWSSIGMAAAAPIFLFASTEMVTRIPIHSRVLGAVRLVITLVVAGIAGWISYWHMASVASILGEDATSAHLYPLVIDGMMVVATISLIELGRLARTVTTIVESITAAEQAAADQAAQQAAQLAAEQAAEQARLDAAAAKAAADRRDRAAKAAEQDRLEALAVKAAAEGALAAARADALYAAMTPAEKAAWTRDYNRGLTVPSVADLVEVTR